MSVRESVKLCIAIALAYVNFIKIEIDGNSGNISVGGFKQAKYRYFTLVLEFYFVGSFAQNLLSSSMLLIYERFLGLWPELSGR